MNPGTENFLEEIQNVKGAIEAILFAAGHPVKYSTLAAVLGLDEISAKRLTEEIRWEYGERGGGILFLTFEDSCQLCTRETYSPYIREALGIKRGGNLSASSMEALAVVAYNQPVTRSFVDQVRGVDSSYAMNSLLDKGLIASCGRLDAPGRPMLYCTTDKFLRVFGIDSLDMLPATETIIPPKEETPVAPE